MNHVVNVPFREGTGWLMRMMDRIYKNGATAEELDLLQEVTKQIEGHTIYALGDARHGQYRD